MPLSVQHQMKLYDLGGLFDHQYKVPKNPWCTHNGNGLARIFNQSYHSVYHTDSYRAPHFKDWQKHVLRYQPPRDGENCFYPFSQYGGTPVIADFVPHRAEVSASHTKARHRQLKYNRFGMTDPIRLGQQFKDTGLLQDLYMPKYRTYAQLSTEQREVAEDAKEHYISNFMAYARNHAILALASCNHGDPDGGASHPRGRHRRPPTRGTTAVPSSSAVAPQPLSDRSHTGMSRSRSCKSKPTVLHDPRSPATTRASPASGSTASA
jgi:hypothetical protein